MYIFVLQLIPRMPLCLENASNDEFEVMEIFLVKDGLGDGDNGTGAGRESMTGS